MPLSEQTILSLWECEQLCFSVRPLDQELHKCVGRVEYEVEAELNQREMIWGQAIRVVGASQSRHRTLCPIKEESSSS